MPTPTDARERARGRILDLLRCPLCRERLAPADGALRCPARHTFDLPRQGYVSLLSGGRRAASADTAAIAQAREELLGPGPYAPPGRALAAPASEARRPGPRPRDGRDVGRVASAAGAARRVRPRAQRVRAAQRRGVPPGAAPRRRAARRDAGGPAPGRTARARRHAGGRSGQGGAAEP